MNDSATIASGEPSAREHEGEDWGGFLRFVALLVLAVLAFRSFVFSPFTIPSESMLPRLMVGDYLVAAKWPYGYSNLSLPFGAPLIPGRVFADLPDRGDVVVFKHPVDGSDYIKRVVGLPGDTVAVRGGQVILNGDPVPRKRIDDLLLRTSANTSCAWGAAEEQSATGSTCRYARYLETLPSGRTYRVLDFGPTPQDDYGPVVVPEGRVFVMGDNRDNSQDSRFPARAGGGVGMVSADLLVGRAAAVLWSTDGSAEWLLPWTWFTAARWDRIGEGV